MVSNENVDVDSASTSSNYKKLVYPSMPEWLKKLISMETKFKDEEYLPDIEKDLSI